MHCSSQHLYAVQLRLHSPAIYIEYVVVSVQAAHCTNMASTQIPYQLDRTRHLRPLPTVAPEDACRIAGDVRAGTPLLFGILLDDGASFCNNFALAYGATRSGHQKDRAPSCRSILA